MAGIFKVCSDIVNHVVFVRCFKNEYKSITKSKHEKHLTKIGKN